MLIKEVLVLKKINFFTDKKIRNLHFVGIGGISMSGLAEIALDLGYTISGSDLTPSSTTKRLENKGVPIHYGHNESNIVNADCIIYTAAIKNDSPELLKAHALNIPIMERSVFLGQIMENYTYSIAVSGTHGKTTTTSMISIIMIESNLNPTVHIGGELSSIGGSTKIGGNKFFITEACEYVESFLKMNPYLAVVLNIEADHLDYFKDLEHIKTSFFKFLSLVPNNGYVVACADETNILSILDNINCNRVTYSIDNKNASWNAKDITFNELGFASYKLLYNNMEFSQINLNVPGMHNVSNSLAAIATCHTLGCSKSSIISGIEKYVGVGRRYEFKGKIRDIKIIDDYAHHPSEIVATLDAAKRTHPSKIWCVFQPHTYTRTKALLNEFASSFGNADTIIVTDIYSAREKDTGEIHSTDLCKRIVQIGKTALYMSSFESIVEYLKENASQGDLIITMGAGDIYKVGDLFLKDKTL